MIRSLLNIFKLNSKKILSKSIFYNLSIILFILFISEITIRIITDSNSTQINKKQIKTNYKNKPNLNLKFSRKLINSSEIILPELISFRTDKYGSIVPSTLENIQKKDKYVLFCGGSTTESSQVKENLRPTDIFMKTSKYKAINFGKAGQTLSGCINTIDSYMKNFKNLSNLEKMPHKIVIATSVNNLMEYGRKVSTESINLNYENKNIFQLKSLNLLNKTIKRNLNNLKIGSLLSNYEHSLLEGCCFGIARINSKYTGKKILDWEENINQKNYSVFTEKKMNALYNIALKHKFNPQDIILTVEPDSFALEKENLYTKTWKNYDARQLIYHYSGDKMSFKESSKIMEKYNSIYSKTAKKFRFLIFQPNSIKFPKYSFYDAVHYTDKGSDYLGKEYANFIK